MMYYTIVCAVIGVILGLTLSATNAKKYPMLLQWIGLFGSLFIRGLTCLVLPLVMTSIINGIASMFDMGANFKKIGGLTIAYYAATTLLSVVEAAAAGNLVGLAYKKDEHEILIAPPSVYWDEGATVKLTFAEYELNSKYFNSTIANKITYQFANTPTVVEVDYSQMEFHHEQVIYFDLPKVEDIGYLRNMKIYQEDGTILYNVEKELLMIKDYASTNEISDSLINLTYSLVPNSLVGTLVGCPPSGCSPNLLSVLVFSVLFAMFTVVIRERKKKLDPEFKDLIIPLVEQLMATFMKCINLVLAATPLAILSLVAQAIGMNTLDELGDVLSSLGIMFAATIVLLIFHLVVTLSGISFLFTQRNPYRFLYNMRETIYMTLATASSASAFPVTLRCCLNEGLPPPIVRFVLSLGLTINMNGSAISISMIVIWLARQVGEPLSFAQNIMLAITSALMSAGASPIPGLTPFVILTWAAVKGSVPVPAQISYILAIDWLIDRILTTVNVLGDSFGALVIGTRLAHTELEGYENDDIEGDAGLTPIKPLEK